MANQTKLNIKELYRKLCPACRDILIAQIKEDLVDTQIRDQLEEKD